MEKYDCPLGLLCEWPLCRFANAFGKPNTGMHAKFRFLNIAWLDVFWLILCAVAANVLLKWSIWNTTVCLILISILAHRTFCVRTTIDKLIFYD